MSKRSLIILAAGFIVLGALVLLPLWTGRESGTPTSDQDPLGMHAYTADTLSRVVITDPAGAGERTVEHTGANWTVNGQPASPEQMERFFESLRTIRVTATAARNEATHAQLGVDEPTATAVRFEANSRDPQTLLVGKTGREFGTWYVRRQGDATVYEVTSTLRDQVQQSADAWRNRDIIRIDAAALQTIAYEGHDTLRSMQKSENGTWQVTRADDATTDVEEQSATDLLAAIAPFTATGFVDVEEDRSVFTDAPGKITVRFLGTGDTVLGTIQLLKRDETTWWVQAEGQDAVFELSSTSVDPLFLAAPGV